MNTHSCQFTGNKHSEFPHTIFTGPLDLAGWWPPSNSDNIHRDIVECIVVEILKHSCKCGHSDVEWLFIFVSDEVDYIVSSEYTIDINLTRSLPGDIEAVSTAVLYHQVDWSCTWYCMCVSMSVSEREREREGGRERERD